MPVAQSAAHEVAVSPASHLPLPQVAVAGQSLAQFAVVSPASHLPLPQTAAGGVVPPPPLQSAQVEPVHALLGLPLVGIVPSAKQQSPYCEHWLSQ